MPDSWDWRNLNDSINTARDRFVGKTVKVEAGGFIQTGIMLGITQRREIVLKTPKNGVQTLSPVERIEVTDVD